MVLILKAGDLLCVSVCPLLRVCVFAHTSVLAFLASHTAVDCLSRSLIPRPVPLYLFLYVVQANVLILFPVLAALSVTVSFSLSVSQQEKMTTGENRVENPPNHIISVRCVCCAQPVLPALPL